MRRCGTWLRELPAGRSLPSELTEIHLVSRRCRFRAGWHDVVHFGVTEGSITPNANKRHFVLHSNPLPRGVDPSDSQKSRHDFPLGPFYPSIFMEKLETSNEIRKQGRLEEIIGASSQN